MFCTDDRDPFAIESFVEGLWRKMRACEGVTKASDLFGYSRSCTRIDMIRIGGVAVCPSVSGIGIAVAFW